MIVEPIAGDRPADNIANPVGPALLQRLDHDLRAHLARPGGRRRPGRPGRREASSREIIRDGGFTRVRRATEGPFNMVLEARS